MSSPTRTRSRPRPRGPSQLRSAAASSTAGSSGRRLALLEPPGLYLSGADAEEVADLFAGTALDARVVSDEIGAASAVKVAYAAWTKGTAALVLAVESFARAEGVSETVHDEWRLSQPGLPERSAGAARSAAVKGWRWVGEMEEIAAAFSSHDLPAGFHEAAAEIFRSAATDPRPEWPHGVRS